MYGWLIVCSRPIGTARSSWAWGRWAGGRNRAREIRDRASRSLGSRIPRLRTCCAIAAPGLGSRWPGLGMFARLVELEILHLELDLAAAVPLVDRRVKHQRAEGVRRQR